MKRNTILYMQNHIFLNGVKQMKPNQKRVYLCIFVLPSNS